MDENHPENEDHYNFYGWKENALDTLPLHHEKVRPEKIALYSFTYYS